MLNKRIGIIMAGGKGARLDPLTKITNKHLLPVYNKPMIFYPLSNLIRMGHKIIYIVTNKKDIKLFKKVIKIDKKLNIKINYIIQNKPKGIAHCFELLKHKIIGKKVTLILGDNFFLSNFINIDLYLKMEGCTIVGTEVKNPTEYGVINFKKKKIVSIIEKPKKPKSNLVATGLYFYDENVLDYYKNIKASRRGELEITDINNIYIKKNNCNFFPLASTDTWYDLGNFDDLIDCSNFLKIYQSKRNLNFGNLNNLKKSYFK